MGTRERQKESPGKVFASIGVRRVRCFILYPVPKCHFHRDSIGVRKCGALFCTRTKVPFHEDCVVVRQVWCFPVPKYHFYKHSVGVKQMWYFILYPVPKSHFHRHSVVEVSPFPSTNHKSILCARTVQKFHICKMKYLDAASSCFSTAHKLAGIRPGLVILPPRI